MISTIVVTILDSAEETPQMKEKVALYDHYEVMDDEELSTAFREAKRKK